MQTLRLHPFGLRMPDDLKAAVKHAATQDGRSMNAQIVQHLREIYQPDGDAQFKARRAEKAAD